MNRAARFQCSLVVGSLLCGIALAGCGGASSPDASGPRLVTPTTLGGSAGVGPVIVDGAAASPGAHPGVGGAVLSDRAITVTASGRRPSDHTGFVVVTVGVNVENRSSGPITNDASSFGLIVGSGDAFAVRATSDPFFAPVGAGASAQGTVEFEVPRASTSRLSLMYRSDNGSSAVVVPIAS